MKKINELKDFGYINIFGTFLISFFFYLLNYYARKNEFGFFGLNHYVCFLANGYFIIHNIKSEWGEEKNLFDAFILVPIIGAIAFVFWAIIFFTLDMFLNFSFYLMYILPINFL